MERMIYTAKFGGMQISGKLKRIVQFQLILFCLLVFSQRIFGQEEKSRILEDKLQKEVESLIENSSAVTGFTAVDLTTGKEFSYNADLEFPQASAIKIPILMEVFAQASEGKLDLSEKRKVKPINTVAGTGIIKHLSATPVFSIEDLCNLMIILSDNSATNSLIDLLGMSEINKRLASLGLEQTLVQRKMINSAASGRGEENLSTPAEAAEILKTLYEGDFIDKATSKKIIQILRKTERRDSSLAQGIPNEIPMAFKTGFLNGVSTEWAIIFLAERPYAIAIMESFKVNNESTKVVENISETIFKYFWRMGNATKYGTYIAPELIKKGSEEKLSAKTI